MSISYRLTKRTSSLGLWPVRSTIRSRSRSVSGRSGSRQQLPHPVQRNLSKRFPDVIGGFPISEARRFFQEARARATERFSAPAAADKRGVRRLALPARWL